MSEKHVCSESCMVESAGFLVCSVTGVCVRQILFDSTHNRSIDEDNITTETSQPSTKKKVTYINISSSNKKRKRRRSVNKFKPLGEHETYWLLNSMLGKIEEKSQPVRRQAVLIEYAKDDRIHILSTFIIKMWSLCNDNIDVSCSSNGFTIGTTYALVHGLEIDGTTLFPRNTFLKTSIPPIPSLSSLGIEKNIIRSGSNAFLTTVNTLWCNDKRNVISLFSTLEPLFNIND